MADTAKTERQTGMFRSLTKSLFGPAHVAETQAMDRLRARAVPLDAFRWRMFDVKVSVESETARELVRGDIGAGMDLTTALAKIEEVLFAHVASEIATFDVFAALPLPRGEKASNARNERVAAVRPYVDSLDTVRAEVRKRLKFLTANPTIPDLESVRFVQEFAKAATARNFPGAEHAVAAGRILAEIAFRNLPLRDERLSIRLPERKFFDEKRVADRAVVVPSEAAGVFFEGIDNGRTTTHLGLRHFAKMAKQVERHGAVRDFPPFGEQLLSGARRAVLRAMEGLDRPRFAELAPYAAELMKTAEAILARHARDIATVKAMDVNDHASLEAGINAMLDISHRSGNECAKLSEGFLSTFAAYRNSLPKDENAAREPISREKIDTLLPAMKDSELDLSLRDYVNYLKGRVEGEEIAEILKAASKAKTESDYMRFIGPDNAYRRTADTLLEQIKQDDEKHVSESFNPDMARGLLIFRNSTTSDVVNKRVRDFERTREKACKGISEMFANPMFITDRRFGQVVAEMESIRTASTEVYAHFADAFLAAWDRIPAMVLELQIQPDEKFIKARTAERMQSLSMGMSR